MAPFGWSFFWRDGSERTEPMVLPGESLQFTAAACRLARDIWIAKRSAFDEPRQWSDLPADVRHRRISMAVWILKAERRQA